MMRGHAYPASPTGFMTNCREILPILAHAQLVKTSSPSFIWTRLCTQLQRRCFSFGRDTQISWRCKRRREMSTQQPKMGCGAISTDASVMIQKRRSVF